MIRPHMEYMDFIVESGTKEKIEKLDKTQDKALRHIEFCNDKEDRLNYYLLRNKYNKEELSVSRKISLLQIMYGNSKSNENVEIQTHNIVNNQMNNTTPSVFVSWYNTTFNITDI